MPDDERFVTALEKRMSEEGAMTELSDDVEGSLARRGFGVRRRADSSALYYWLGSTSVIVFVDRFKVFGGGELLGEGTTVADLDKHVIAEPGQRKRW